MALLCHHITISWCCDVTTWSCDINIITHHGIVISLPCCSMLHLWPQLATQILFFTARTGWIKPQVWRYTSWIWIQVQTLPAWPYQLAWICREGGLSFIQSCPCLWLVPPFHQRWKLADLRIPASCHVPFSAMQWIKQLALWRSSKELHPWQYLHDCRSFPFMSYYQFQPVQSDLMYMYIFICKTNGSWEQET